MMRFATIITLLAFAVATNAQENADKRQVDTAPVETLDDVYVDDDREYLNGMVPMASFDDKSMTATNDSLHLPTLDYLGGMPVRRHWWYPHMGAFGGWNIHEGLNVSLGLSAFTSFGGAAFSGWGQDLSAVYAKALNKKWSIAVGAYLTNYSTNRGDFRSAGINAIVSYRFNEHWEAFVYGQKAFVNNGCSLYNWYGPYGFGPYGLGYPMYSPYALERMGDRIGAGVCWSPNNNFSFSVQLEYNKLPNNLHGTVENHWQMPTPRE